MSSSPTCRHCHATLKTPLAGYYRRRGFCDSKCDKAYVPVLRTVLCANDTCKKGEAGTRKVFTTYQSHARCCSNTCNNIQWQRERAWRYASRTRRTATTPTAPTPVPVDLDLPAEVIEAKLAALAKRRRETRSWLRIADPWAQRAGSELHKQACVPSFDLDSSDYVAGTAGAYLQQPGEIVPLPELRFNTKYEVPTQTGVTR